MTLQIRGIVGAIGAGQGLRLALHLLRDPLAVVDDVVGPDAVQRMG
jgi:hypothetical protein